MANRNRKFKLEFYLSLGHKINRYCINVLAMTCTPFFFACLALIFHFKKKKYAQFEFLQTSTPHFLYSKQNKTPKSFEFQILISIHLKKKKQVLPLAMPNAERVQPQQQQQIHASMCNINPMYDHCLFLFISVVFV